MQRVTPSLTVYSRSHGSLRRNGAPAVKRSDGTLTSTGVVTLAPAFSPGLPALGGLERLGVIRGCSINVDAMALGLRLLAFIGISSKKPCSERVESLRAIPAVEECHSVAGELSMLLKVRVADTAMLPAMTERLRKVPGSSRPARRSC